MFRGMRIQKILNLFQGFNGKEMEAKNRALEFDDEENAREGKRCPNCLLREAL
jgi:hypothetical protein